MGRMGEKKPRPRRPFTLEFKVEIVELCQRGDRSIGQVLSRRRAEQRARARALSVLPR